MLTSTVFKDNFFFKSSISTLPYLSVSTYIILNPDSFNLSKLESTDSCSILLVNISKLSPFAILEEYLLSI